MNRGLVIGDVWATRKAAGLAGRSLKLVALLTEPDDDDRQRETPPAPTGRVVVAVDTLDARTGQEVLVAFGSGGRNVILPGPGNRGLLCDAAIALLVERGASR